MALKLGPLELGDSRQGKLCGDKESVQQDKQSPSDEANGELGWGRGLNVDTEQ
jgi:hypothetical protein